MHRYHQLGKVPRKRHTILRKPDGGIYYEELKGNKGFDGPSSLLYHIHRPTTVKSSRLIKEYKLEKDPDPSLRMRHLKTSQLPRGGSPTVDRIPLMFNNDCVLSMAFPDKEDDFFFRNAQADEVVYVSEGSGILETAFGEHKYRKGDYLVIPRGIMHRYKMDDCSHIFFITEGTGEVNTPSRYRNEYGQLIERSPYSERDFRVPENLQSIDRIEDTPVMVKARNCLTEVILDHHPFDLIGWDGYYYPYAFNIEDFEPIVGRTHEPPPVHQTFQGHNFVICSFCPRPYDFDPEAIPAPYNHANIMSDEVIYYAKSEFMSRKGMEYGSITLHPDGITHGPHPGKMEESIGAKWTDELAVMVDTFYPLYVCKEALNIEDQEYTKIVAGLIRDNIVEGFRSFAERLVDYAGLFPPAKLELDKAAALYADYLNCNDSWLLGRFICPTGCLIELDQFLNVTKDANGFRVAGLGRGGDDADAFLQSVEADLSIMDYFLDKHHERATINAFESILPPLNGDDEGLMDRFQECLDRHQNSRLLVSLEVKLGDEWRQDIENAVAAVRYINRTYRQKLPHVGLKLRCGGETPEATPSAEQISHFICSCRDPEIPFKFTAGLHHPIRHTDSETNASVHGFINVFGSALLAHEHHLSQDQICSILTDTQADSFGFNQEGLYWRNLSIPTARIDELRQKRVLSFGSCSFTEPRDDLKSLGWLK